MLYLKQSTAVTLKIGPFLDSTDGDTEETGLTISQADVRLSKNGGNMAQKNEATSCTHDELGIYDCPIDTTDTNTLGRLQLFVHETGALSVFHDYMVLTAEAYDTLHGTDVWGVDVIQVSGDATAADNLEADYDGTGYAKSSSTIGTCTTNTDMRGTDNAALASELAKVPKSDGTDTWNSTALASINAEVDTALNTAIPGTPTADSLNDYIQRMKYVMVNKMEITEASGDTTIYQDNDVTVYATVLAAYTSDATTTTRKRLE